MRTQDEIQTELERLSQQYADFQAVLKRGEMTDSQRFETAKLFDRIQLLKWVIA